MPSDKADFNKCFPKEFLELRQFSSPYDTYPDPDNPDKLLKLPAHKKFNTPPFDAFKPDRPAFHLTDSNIGFGDLDLCFRQNGQLKDWAHDFVQKWGCLTTNEQSVSGNGCHFFFELEDSIPKDECTGEYKVKGDKFDLKSGGVDYFVKTRWAALTGIPAVMAHPEMMKLDLAGWEEFKRELLSLRPNIKEKDKKQTTWAAKEKTKLTATQVADRIMTRELPVGTKEEKNEANRAFSQSVGFAHRHPADLDFAFYLVKYSGLSQADQLARFEKFKLHAEREDGYNASTFDAARSRVADKETPKRKLFLNVGCMATVKYKKQNWLKRHILLRAALNLFVGDPDIGKTLVIIYYIAELSLAGKKTVIICREDAYDSVWLPRLIVAGANLEHVHPVFNVKVDLDGVVTEDNWMLDNLEHIKLLGQAIREYKAELCLIDPLLDFTGTLNMNLMGDVRAITGPLNEIAQETDAAIVVNCHTTKALVDSAIKAAAGSMQLSGAVPISWLFVKHPHIKNMRLMAQGRNKHGKKRSLKYVIESVPWPEEQCGKEDLLPGEVSDGVGKCVFRGVSDLTAEDVLKLSLQREEPEIERVRRWIIEILAHGPVESHLCWREAKTRGFKRDGVNRACDQLNVARDKKTWTLPVEGGEAAAADFLKQLLKEGRKLPASTCVSEMGDAGFDTHKIDLTNIRRMASIKSTKDGKDSEWYIAAAEDFTADMFEEEEVQQ